jgi:hypothetical protein
LFDRPSRVRRVEHAVHGEFDLVKAGAPDHLSPIGQDDHVPTRVHKANGLDAGRIAKEIGAKIAEPDDCPLLRSEKAPFQMDLGGPTLRLIPKVSSRRDGSARHSARTPTAGRRLDTERILQILETEMDLVPGIFRRNLQIDSLTTARLLFPQPPLGTPDGPKG